MAEPTLPFLALTTAGITVMGVATGIHPGLLIAGVGGGLWALSYQPPAGWLARVFFLLVSALVAGYITPVGAAVAASGATAMLPWWPTDITRDVLQFPIGFVIGFLAVRWFGPALLRRADKIEGEH